jgi:hypothetical protein
MKKYGYKSFGVLILLMVLVIPAFSAEMEVSDEAGAQAVKVNAIDRQIVELTKELELTEDQKMKCIDVFKMMENQAKRDREMYKTNPLALIHFAHTRRQMGDQRIGTFLEPEQKEKFERYKKRRMRKNGIFELTEGLLLTEVQVVQVEHVLDEFRRKNGGPMSENMNSGMKGGGEGMRGGGGGMMGGDMMGGGGGMRGGGGGMRGGGGKGGGSGMRGSRGSGSEPGERMTSMLKERERKKEKALKKYLTKEQRKQYKEIKKDRIKKMKQMIKERMKNRIK